MILGIVADDVTGANDIGSMCAKAGYLTHVLNAEGPDADGPALAASEVCILDTNSRLDDPATAYRKVFAATRRLQAAGCRQFFNKTCSVFRGNIGVEFDAMLDALGREFAVVVLGFPKNGRTTVDGIHYVRGVRLEDSEFRHDPIHPMTRSDLVGILGAQTRRRVALLTQATVRQGADALRTAIDRMRAACNYLILDVTDQADLATIAGAVRDEPVLCGSSALAEELPAHWPAPAPQSGGLDLPRQAGLGILCTAGSLMPQTQAQIETLVAARAYRATLNPDALFDPAQRESEISRLSKSITIHLATGRDVVFHSPNDPAAVESARAAGSRAGLSATEVAWAVSAVLAEVTARVLSQTGLVRLIVAGGETSAAVCARLGVTGMRVWQEISPGLPSCLSLTQPPRLLVLKSGSFGAPDFFLNALAHLRAW